MSTVDPSGLGIMNYDPTCRSRDCTTNLDAVAHVAAGSEEYTGDNPDVLFNTSGEWIDREHTEWYAATGAPIDPSQEAPASTVPTQAQNQDQQQQQPNSSQASSTHFASVSFWSSGAGHLGHTGIGVDTDDTSGFVPGTHHSFWAILTGFFFGGGVQDDIKARTNPATGEVASHSYLHIPISDAQAAAMQRAIEDRRGNPGSYSLYFRNCAGFVEYVLHAGGVGGVPHSEIFFPPVLYGMLWYVNTWR
jgi:hypothetical protein